MGRIVRVLIGVHGLEGERVCVAHNINIQHPRVSLLLTYASRPLLDISTEQQERQGEERQEGQTQEKE